MAILGGGVGGAGNPVGGSFTGAAQALEIYGDFALAYSGLRSANNSDVTHLEFTSGNYLFVGELAVTGAITESASNLGSGYITKFTTSFNGQELIFLKMDTENEDQPMTITIPLIIPSYTEVKVVAVGTADASTFKTSAALAGRIYRD